MAPNKARYTGERTPRSGSGRIPMRCLPTRREVILGTVFIISSLVFVQYVFRPSWGNQNSGYDISGRVGNIGLSGDKGSRPNYGGAKWMPSAKPGLPLDGVSGDARKPTSVWDMGTTLTTEILTHVPGWTVFDRLYIFNGTVYIVTNEPESVPDRVVLTSSGYPIPWQNLSEEIAKQRPTDRDLQIITTEAAVSLFGSFASPMEGTNFIVNDAPQFINHYYHWSSEILFGLWRAYSTLDPDITADGRTKLSAPRRILLPHIPYTGWRDYASMNQWVTRGGFPSISLEFQEDWADRASMLRPFLLERAILADRAAAMHSPNFVETQLYTAALFELKSSPYWWTTIRNNLVEFSGEDTNAQSSKVITYASRQEWGRKMLSQEDHRRLVTALQALRDRYGYEIHIVSMDRLSREEQIRLAARTTIMMGVHGNGLTSLLWMKPNPKATVIEFFFPGEFSYKYELTARALGMKHYGFWGNKSFTAPHLPPVNYLSRFQGNDVPIDGDVVARLCHERLSLPEADH